MFFFGKFPCKNRRRVVIQPFKVFTKILKTQFVFTSSFHLPPGLSDGDLSRVDAADHCALRGDKHHFERLLGLLKVIPNDLSVPASL